MWGTLTTPQPRPCTALSTDGLGLEATAKDGVSQIVPGQQDGHGCGGRYLPDIEPVAQET